MTNRKLSELPELVSVADEDIIHIVDDSEGNLLNKNKRITLANLFADVGSKLLITDTGAFSEPEVEQIQFPAGAVSEIANGFVSVVTGEPYVDINSTGTNPTALADDSIAIGESVVIDAAATDSIGIGRAAQVDASGSVVIGNDSSTSETNAISIGPNINNYSGGGVGIGRAATVGSNLATKTSGVAVGDASRAIGDHTIALGAAWANADQSISIGQNSNVQGRNSVAIGIDTIAGDTSATENCVSIGNTAVARGINSIAIGRFATSGGGNIEGEQIAIGHLCDVSGGTGQGNVAVGNSNTVSNGTQSVYLATRQVQIFGNDNTVSDSIDIQIYGENNNVVGASDALLAGEDNEILSVTNTTGGAACTQTTLLGFQNELILTDESDAWDSNTIVGDNNVVQQSARTMILGYDNNLDNTLTLGFTDPILNSTNNIIIGGANNLTQSNFNYLIGSNSTLSITQGSKLLGNNTVTKLNDCISIGDNSLTTDNVGITEPVESLIDPVITIGYNNVFFTTDNLAAEGNVIQLGNTLLNQSGGSGGSIQIGNTNTVLDGSPDSIAIGTNADIGSTAPSAVQIATGSNTTAETLQYLTNRLANAEGLYTSFTSPINYAPVDDDNITSHLEAIDVSLGTIDTLIGNNDSDITTLQTDVGTNTTDIATNVTNIGNNTTAIGTNTTDIGTNATNISTNAGDIVTINNTLPELEIVATEISSGINVDLLLTSEKRQFITPTATIDVNLPALPVDTTWFLVVNDDPGSGFDLVVKDDGGTTLDTLGTGGTSNHATFIYTGLNWKVII